MTGKMGMRPCKQSYQELGGDYFEKHQREIYCHRLVKQLESLGMRVTLEELPAAV